MKTKYYLFSKPGYNLDYNFVCKVESNGIWARFIYKSYRNSPTGWTKLTTTENELIENNPYFKLVTESELALIL